MMPGFCGSYRPEDVHILLKPMALAGIADVAEKERLIQSGARHYSEMITPEKAPSARYLDLFHQAFAQNRQTMARDVLRLADRLATRTGDITLVSLARAGTPVGVLLRHTLQRVHARPAAHYSISIIRDRGIDRNALDYILARHPAESLVFIDGWTGKGVITRELVHSIAAFNAERGCQISPDLYVLSDLAGCATVAASGDDYLIPSSILNATVSGLVSRSILNEAIGPADFHGCLFYREFASIDLSQWFIDEVLADIQQLAQNPARAFAVPDRQALAATSARFMADMRARFGIHNENLIKPGIGEATRVLLRRLPERVLVQDPAHPAVQHLLALAAEKAVPVEHDPDLPYAAASLIRSLADA